MNMLPRGKSKAENDYAGDTRTSPRSLTKVGCETNEILGWIKLTPAGITKKSRDLLVFHRIS